MDKLRCQSCGMPLADADQSNFGTDKSDSPNRDFCKFCFKDGEFTQPDLTLEDMVNRSVEFMTTKLGYEREKAREMSLGVIPGLKRWQNDQSCSYEPGNAVNMAGAARMKAAGDTGKEAARAGQMAKTEEQWKENLTPEQYRILRMKGTEAPFSGEYYKNKADGMYLCAACGNELFSSATKFESGTGWPSFYKPAGEANVGTKADNSHGMQRTEVTCSHCGGHLGHVFDDGPVPTGQRYCINSGALKFKEKNSL